MATWLAHMRIAEYFMNIDKQINCVDFLVGSIAPDCGVPNENWSKFTPEKHITHCQLDGKNIDAENFRTKYIVKNENGFSFYLGYYFHLLTDIAFSRYFKKVTEQIQIILYLISKIKPEDMELKEHLFKIQDFCKICGLDSSNGANYIYIKKTLKDLRDKSIWVTLDDGSETILAWLDTVTIYKDIGTVKLKIAEMMKPYLLFLKERYTQYELLYTLAMKSQYSVRLYELLKSYEYQKTKIFDIEELKLRLSAENYKRFPDFRRKVLDKAIQEINSLSDLNVTYSIIKESRRYSEIEFNIKIKKDIQERAKTWANIEKIIGYEQ